MNPILLITVDANTFVPYLLDLIQLSYDIGRGGGGKISHYYRGGGAAKYRTITGGGSLEQPLID